MSMTLQEQKEVIMRDFDFEHVEKCMRLLDWKYLGTAVPTLSEIKESALDKLDIVIEQVGMEDYADAEECASVRRIQGGGFEAEVINGKWLRLIFLLEEYEVEETEELDWVEVYHG